MIVNYYLAVNSYLLFLFNHRIGYLSNQWNRSHVMLSAWCANCGKRVGLEKGGCGKCGGAVTGLRSTEDVTEKQKIKELSRTERESFFNTKQALVDVQKEITDKKSGNLSGIFACVFAVLAVFTVALLFLPLALLFAFIGFIQSLEAKNGSGVMISVVSVIISIGAVIVSPTIWFVFGTAFSGYSDYIDKAKLASEQAAKIESVQALKIQPLNMDDDFRMFHWGDTYQHVKSTEILDLIEHDTDSLTYKSNVSGIDVATTYLFIDDKLVRAAYTNTSKHINANKYITDYMQLNMLVKKKYDDPVKVDSVWSNDLFKGDDQNLGTAISMGHLTYRSEWNNGVTNIISALIGDNLNIKHVIIYTDINSLSKIDAADKSATNQL